MTKWAKQWYWGLRVGFVLLTLSGLFLLVRGLHLGGMTNLMIALVYWHIMCRHDEIYALLLDHDASMARIEQLRKLAEQGAPIETDEPTEVLHMSLFQCAVCGCVENTAVCNYHQRKLEKKPLLCSECDPDIGEWHGHFPKQHAGDMLVDQAGHLWSPQSLMQAPAYVRIVDVVPREG